MYVKASRTFKNEGFIVPEGTPGILVYGQIVAGGTGLKVQWEAALDADNSHVEVKDKDVWSPMDAVAYRQV